MNSHVAVRRSTALFVPVAALALLAGVTTAPGIILMVDDFADGNIEVLNADLVIGSKFGSVSATVSGGTRDLEVRVTAPNLGLTRAQVNTAAFIETVLDVANNSPPSIVTLGYDANGVGLNNAGAGNFSAYNAFIVTMNEAQLAGGAMSAAVRVTDSASRTSTLAVQLTTDITSDTSFSFPFASFVGAPIDFAQLRSIEVIFDTLSNPNIDYQVESIQAIPEPTAWCLLSCAAGTALLRRRRRD